ncbi:MAG TPA: hypothetical protein VE127_07475 [Solirubrobacteraceae bacterium]|nr:hypothetical protein [Solirubrobacteraceae bacterium]
MRRLVVIATALAVLVGAVSAYAATGGLNAYTAKIKFSPNKAGKGKAPAAIAFTEHYKADGTNGNRTAPLTGIKTKVYGIHVNPKGFPTCSQSKIANAHSDAGCPKGALVATGAITAILGPVADPSTSDPNQIPCNPILHAWNGGGGKLVFFFVDKAPNHTCGPIQTGAVPPFVGTAKTVGKNLVQNTPIPSYVSFPITGVEGSLTSETLHYLKLTRKVHGKTVAYASSVGCKKGKRPYSVTFTAESSPGAAPQSGTASGTQKCK